MDVASPKGMIVHPSWTFGCARFRARNHGDLLDDMFWAVCTVSVLDSVVLALAHAEIFSLGQFESPREGW